MAGAAGGFVHSSSSVRARSAIFATAGGPVSAGAFVGTGAAGDTVGAGGVEAAAGETVGTGGVDAAAGGTIFAGGAVVAGGTVGAMGAGGTVGAVGMTCELDGGAVEGFTSGSADGPVGLETTAGAGAGGLESSSHDVLAGAGFGWASRTGVVSVGFGSGGGAASNESGQLSTTGSVAGIVDGLGSSSPMVEAA